MVERMPRGLPEERCLAVLLDGERVRLFRLEGDLVEELRDPLLVRAPVAGEPVRPAAAGAPGRGGHGHSSLRGRDAEQLPVLDAACDHVHRTADRLAYLARAERVDRLLAGGAPECVAELRRILRMRLGGDVEALALPTTASALQVAEAARGTARAEPTTPEERVLGQLLDAVGRGRAALGPVAVTEAANEHSASLLVVARGTTVAGAYCIGCGSVFAEPAPAACPTCAAPLREDADILQRIVERVRESDGLAEEINGPAGDTLRAFGGLAALLRYTLPGAGLATPWGEAAAPA